VRARARALLGAERTALNFLQRLSGVASAAARAVEAVKPHPVMVVDTRKTTPGLRMLEKYAVRAGGASNHRFGLDDAVLIKENHLRLAGGVTRAVELVRRRVGPLVKIEVEAENLGQVREALEAGVEIIMLDNMPLDEMSRAVSLAAGRVLLEASGNIGLDDLARTAAVGVDFISLGWITHSAPALDFSLMLT
jgi:nicotinate-nucleotide pyrophosphorylase (carboxylating)